MVACVLALNTHSFEVHETSSSLKGEVLEVKRLTDEYGGHLELHPTIVPFLTNANEQEDSESTEMERNREDGNSSTEISSSLASEPQPQTSFSNLENSIIDEHESGSAVNPVVFTIYLKGTLLQ